MSLHALKQGRGRQSQPVGFEEQSVRLVCHPSSNSHTHLNICNQEERVKRSRMMAHLLGLDFLGEGSNSNDGHPNAMAIVNDYGSPSSDVFSDVAGQTDMQQWLQSYADSSIPLHGYYFQSFT